MQWCCILSGEDFLLDFFKTNPVVTNASDNLLFLSFEQVMHFRPKNIHFYSKITDSSESINRSILTWKHTFDI